jgi:hypothetical protein
MLPLLLHAMPTTPATFRGVYLFALITMSAATSQAVADGDLLHGNPSSVEDTRSTFGSTGGCRISVTLVGDNLDSARGVLRTRITRAIDDLDRDLLPVASLGADAATARFGWSARLRDGPIMTSFSLRNPSRHATLIKVIEGEVDVFSPNEANEGTVLIADPLAHPGVSFKSPVLEKYGIEIAYVSEEKAAELNRASAGQPHGASDTFFALDPIDEQRRLDAVAAEVARRRAARELDAAGLSPASTPIIPPNDSASSMLPPSRATLSTTTSSVGKVSRVSFQVKDPKHKVIDLVWRDASGKPLRGAGVARYSSDQVRSMILAEPPPRDAQLVIFVASEGAVQTRPFKVETVALP